MTMFNQYKSELTKQWWTQVSNSVDVLRCYILDDLSQMEHLEKKDFIRTLQSAYQDVQKTRCPDAADSLYTHLTRALLNLRMAHQEYSPYNDSRAREYLRDARQHAIQLQNELMNHAIIFSLAIAA